MHKTASSVVCLCSSCSILCFSCSSALRLCSIRSTSFLFWNWRTFKSISSCMYTNVNLRLLCEGDCQRSTRIFISVLVIRILEYWTKLTSGKYDVIHTNVAIGPIFTGSNCVISFLAGGAPELEGLEASVAPLLDAMLVNTSEINIIRCSWVVPLAAVCWDSYVIYACGFDRIGKWSGFTVSWEFTWIPTNLIYSDRVTYPISNDVKFVRIHEDYL